MLKKPLKLSLDDVYEFATVDFPFVCPHCEIVNRPQFVQKSSVRKDEIEAYLHLHYMNCCDKYLYSLLVKEDGVYKLAHVHPTPTGVFVADELQKLSPLFVRLYKGARLADEQGFDELAGSGYRNALEVLIKDYAIQLLKQPEDEVSQKSLAKAIRSYLDSPLLINGADVVRLIGNDFTHYERKFDRVGLDELRQYLHLVMERIADNYKLANPPV